jgi:hypothetical protein
MARTLKSRVGPLVDAFATRRECFAPQLIEGGLLAVGVEPSTASILAGRAPTHEASILRRSDSEYSSVLSRLVEPLRE